MSTVEKFHIDLMKEENEEEKKKGMKPDFENQVDSADRINLEEKKEIVERIIDIICRVVIIIVKTIGPNFFIV